MAGIIGLRAEDMDQVDALRRARLDWPHGLPMVRPHVLAPVLVRDEEKTIFRPARFGLTRRFSSFNARDDKLATSPVWRGLFGRRHGIVPLSYVVEWVPGPAGVKQPYLIQRADGRVILAPALVGDYRDKKGELGFAICTRPPNRFFARFHDRMVAACPPDVVDRWLAPLGTPEKVLMECLQVPADDELVAIPTAPDIQKRKSGDWSPLRAAGDPVTWRDLEAGRPLAAART